MVQTRSSSSSKKNTTDIKYVSFYFMMQTRSSSKENTDTSIEVNRDVAEASNKNTMNQNKRKTRTAQPIEASKKTTKREVNPWDVGKVTVRETTKQDLALEAFMMEHKVKYIKKHPDAIRLPDEKNYALQKKFRELVKKTKSKIVEEYYKKYRDAKAEKTRQALQQIRQA